MLNQRKMWVLCTLLLLMVALPVFAAVIWDEGVDGDLSNEPGVPTLVSLVGPMMDTMSGTVGGSNPGEFFDVWTLTVPPGGSLTAINLTSYVAAGGNTTSGFNVWPGNSGDLGDFSLALLSSAVGPPQVGTNLIASVSPLGPGDYSISWREGTAGQAWAIEYVGSALPVELQSFSIE